MHRRTGPYRRSERKKSFDIFKTRHVVCSAFIFACERHIVLGRSGENYGLRVSVSRISSRIGASVASMLACLLSVTGKQHFTLARLLRLMLSPSLLCEYLSRYTNLYSPRNGSNTKKHSNTGINRNKTKATTKSVKSKWHFVRPAASTR